MKPSIEGSLEGKFVEDILGDYRKDPKNRVIRNALSRHPISDIVFVSDSLKDTRMTFSNVIKTLPVTNQRASGRCWIFAGLNILREIVAKKLGIKSQFELSQNYISLFDKIEKANYALESIIVLCDREPTDRVFQFILNDPISDGGQWDMFVNLVRKYGLLPKDAFPETYQSENTRELNFLVNGAIRDFASKAHALAKEGKKGEIRELKNQTIAKIYKMFLDAFGVPPTEFDFEYVDEKEKFHKERVTPKSFFEKYIGEEIGEYQSLINSPTDDKPFDRNFTIDFLGNVVEGNPINHVNVSMEEMKAAIIRQLLAGEPVWFGSDVSFYRDRTTFAWDDKAYDYETPFGISQAFDKGAMLDFRHSAMNHAMVITGVDLEEGKALKWKIENSWGDATGDKGYYVMSASWFDRFVYQAVVKNKYLTKEQSKAAKGVPIHLDPWDPMGTLAD